MENYQEIWSKVLLLVKENITSISYKTWFKPISIRQIENNVRIVYLQANDDFVIKILEDRYLPLIEQSFKSVMNEDYRVIIKNSEEYKDDKTEQSKDKITKNLLNPGLDKQKIFNPKYNFENFVVGNSNKYTHAAALAVAESPSKAYNPLFMYGGSGLGKTHLMHAIGIYLLEHNDDINVLYVSSEMFTNEFIKALQENKTREFKNKYRKVDVLLIDDIQFLEGKDTMQEEFFHTFNALYDLNKQIVISSDRAPNKLVNLTDRLTSRFMWNIITELQPADYETRVAILLKKAENANIEVTDDIYEVICLISEKIKNNIRELEGAFNRIVSFSSLMNEKIDKQFAKRILKDIIQNGGNSATPEKIKTIVGRYFNVKVSDMESAKRVSTITFPRQIAMFLCREMTDYSLPKIGNLFGGRHYTTVMHACEKIQKEVSSNESVQEIIDNLKKEINE